MKGGYKMAIYNVTTSYTPITETSGLIQNQGSVKVQFMADSSIPNDKGIYIKPDEVVAYSCSSAGQPYVRTTSGTSVVAVVADKGTGGVLHERI